jgi:hypothetical protein
MEGPAFGDAPVMDFCYDSATAPCENEALRSEHSLAGAPNRRGRKRRLVRLACLPVTAASHMGPPASGLPRLLRELNPLSATA